MFGIWTVLLLAAGLALSYVPGRGDPAPRSVNYGERLDAEVSCRQAIGSNLVSPGSAKYHPHARAQQVSGTWVQRITVDSQNAFGALLRTEWLCKSDGETATVSQVQ